MDDALCGQLWLFWWIKRLHKVFMLNICLVFAAHMFTDKQFALKISQIYKPEAEINKRSLELDRRFEGFIYLAVVATQTQNCTTSLPTATLQKSWCRAQCRVPNQGLSSWLTLSPSLFSILVLSGPDPGCWRLALYICMSCHHRRINTVKDGS